MARVACSVVVAGLVSLSLAPPETAAAPPRPGDDFFLLSRAGVPYCPARTVVAHAPVSLSLRCRGLSSARVRVVKPPAHGRLGRISQRRDRVRYRPRGGFRGTDRLIVARRRGRRIWRMAVLIDVSGRRVGPSCRSRHPVARFRGRARVRLVCRGRGLEPLRLVAGPFSGRIAAVRRSGTPRRRTLTVRLGSAASYVGQDVLIARARGKGGTDLAVGSVSTLPWRMRALGDSVSAGFGYYGNGGLMSILDLPFCKPGNVVTNRCSSNSDAGPSYTGPPEWSADFGLANNVSWAAQFANGVQGGRHITAPDMFQNLAVTGSAPSDWLPGGFLNPQLQAVVAEDPELIAFTMGANPLLTQVLLTVAGESCAFTRTVSALEACIQPFFTKVELVSQLQKFYTALLQAPDSMVVTFQYPLSVPAANLFSTWQLEAMINYFNEQIATAVANTEAALPRQAARLVLIEAQADPGSPPAQQVPRFNLGLPPNGQSWSPPYDCGDNDFVDGPSHQSTPTQDEFLLRHPFTYCSGQEWVIGADSGIHPNSDGYAQFAATLANVMGTRQRVPQLP